MWPHQGPGEGSTVSAAAGRQVARCSSSAYRAGRVVVDDSEPGHDPLDIPCPRRVVPDARGEAGPVVRAELLGEGAVRPFFSGETEPTSVGVVDDVGAIVLEGPGDLPRGRGLEADGTQVQPLRQRQQRTHPEARRRRAVDRPVVAGGIAVALRRRPAIAGGPGRTRMELLGCVHQDLEGVSGRGPPGTELADPEGAADGRETGAPVRAGDAGAEEIHRGERHHRGGWAAFIAPRKRLGLQDGPAVGEQERRGVVRVRCRHDVGAGDGDGGERRRRGRAAVPSPARARVEDRGARSGRAHHDVFLVEHRHGRPFVASRLGRELGVHVAGTSSDGGVPDAARRERLLANITEGRRPVRRVPRRRPGHDLAGRAVGRSRLGSGGCGEQQGQTGQDQQVPRSGGPRVGQRTSSSSYPRRHCALKVKNPGIRGSSEWRRGRLEGCAPSTDGARAVVAHDGEPGHDPLDVPHPRAAVVGPGGEGEPVVVLELGRERTGSARPPCRSRIRRRSCRRRCRRHSSGASRRSCGPVRSPVRWR